MPSEGDSAIGESFKLSLADNPKLLPYVYSLGTVALMKAGQPEQAKKLCRKLLEQLTPKTAGLCNDVAWFLATADVLAHRDPAPAIELAKKTVELDARADSAWQTLGWAHYRMRDWQASIDALEKSCALQQNPKGGDAWQWFCLAMAHKQLSPQG